MAETIQRAAYGKKLVELGKTNRNIVVLDADLSGSTMGKLFEAAYPQRHFEMGIAEANMLSAAAGLSLTGKIPFAASFAVFCAGRAYDQIRQTIAIGRLNVKICGSSAGLSDFGDGATHQAVEDMAIMRAIPNMTVLCPADAIEMEKAVEAAAAMDGPCYIRCNRNGYENTTQASAPFQIGVPTVLAEGNDVAILACGYMVNKALEAVKILADRGICARVINVSTIKPMNGERLWDMVKDVRGIVTAEEHSVIGGLGSAVCEALRLHRIPIEMVGIEDVFGCSAHGYEELLRYYGLTAEAITEKAEKVLSM